MNNIYPNAARERMGQPMYNANVPFVAKVSRTSENASTSSCITVNDNTTFLEMSAVGGTAYMKWIATSDTSASVIGAASGANYDHAIPAGRTVWLPIPQESIGVSSIVGANKQNGLYNRYAYITSPAASVLTTEF